MSMFELLRSFAKKIPLEATEALGESITLDEVSQAIAKLKPNTSPGPDGLTTELYQCHSSCLAKVLLPVFNDALTTGRLPKSFHNATLKLLPKSTKKHTTSDFRPISLINTDMKILSHVLANRLKKALESVIQPDQFAYLPKRDIHTAIMDMQLRLEQLPNTWCLVSVDFTKAFDRVDRKYLFQILRILGVPENLVFMIEHLYANTTACVNVNGFLSKRIHLERGVRQGCPVSALLFITALEPLLDLLRRNDWANCQTHRRLIAYADDLSVFVHKNDLTKLHQLLDKFCAATQFKINRSKTETITKSPDQIMQSSTAAKILGVFVGKRTESEKQNEAKMFETVSSSQKFFNRFMSLGAKAKVMNAFIIPKLLHISRHCLLHNSIQTQYQKASRAIIWGKGRKADIALCHLERTVSEGGIKWPQLSAHNCAAQLTTLRNAVHYDERCKKLLTQVWKANNSEILKNIQANLASCNLQLTILAEHSLFVGKDGRKVEIGPSTKYKHLYRFVLENAQKYEPWKERIQQSCKRFSITEQQLKMVSKEIWSKKPLTSYERNVTFKLLCNCHKDRDVLWNKGLKPRPLCCLCDREFENMEHLFRCPTISPLLLKAGIQSIAEIFKNTNTLKLKTVATILAGAWSEDKPQTIHKLEKLITSSPQ